MLDEHDGDLEGIPDLADVLHQLRRLRGVHARGRFVQQQKAGIGGQSPDDLQTPLGAVGQASGLMVRQILHLEDAQQLQRPLMCYPLVLPVTGQPQDPGKHARVHGVVQADLHVVLHGQGGEQPDILEGPGDAGLVHLHGVHAGGLLAVEEDGAPGGLIDLGQQIEDGGLARAVGADQAHDLCPADGQIEFIHCGQAAEVDAQMHGLQHGGLVDIPLQQHGVGGDFNILTAHGRRLLPLPSPGSSSARRPAFPSPESIRFSGSGCSSPA